MWHDVKLNIGSLIGPNMPMNLNVGYTQDLEPTIHPVGSSYNFIGKGWVTTAR